MRVLWFSTNCANYKSGKGRGSEYNGGGWTSALQNELVKRTDISLGICFCRNQEPARIEQNGCIYYPVPHHVKPLKDKVIDIFKIYDVRRDEILWSYYIEQFRNVISDFKPDVIEVFGSELYVGLATMAAKEMNVPCCLHLQGILSLYIHAYLPMGVSKWKYYLSNGISGIYANWQYLAYWYRSVHREKAILNATFHVIGRTQWDQHALEILNPHARYHYGGEILRPCFYESRQRVLPDKPIIVTTSSAATYKGFDLVLKIANILKHELKLDFYWKVFGNIEPVFFESITGLQHDNVNVELCGVASSEQLRETILGASVYLQPSYIENSPNSVGEAQMLGVPVVATNVGGTDSMVESGKTGFLFPASDPYIGAYYIFQLVKNKELNVLIGNSGKEVAKKRHNPNRIVDDLIILYRSIIND